MLPIPSRLPASRDRAGPIIQYWREKGLPQQILGRNVSIFLDSEKGTAFDAVRMNERTTGVRLRGTIEASERTNERATMMGLSGRTSERGERESDSAREERGVSHATKRTDGQAERERGQQKEDRRRRADGPTDADGGSGGAAPRERRRASYNTGWPHGRAIRRYLLISIVMFGCNEDDDK